MATYNITKIALPSGDIANLKDATATKTEASTTNGNIKIDGTETQVYDDSEIQDKIDETTTSISGNPISISGLKANQLAINPIITLEPIQAGSGTPSPSNIRAISGYDKIEILSCGKNLCEETIINATISVDGTITTSGGSFDMHVARVLQGVTYTIKSDEAQSVSQQFVGGFFYSKPALNSVSYNGTRLANTSATFTSPITGYVAFRTSRGYSVAQCEYGSSQTTYEPYHKTTDLSESLGQTVYGGTLDVRTGIFTVTHAKKRMDGNDTFNGSSIGTNAQLILSDMKVGRWAYDEMAVCDSLPRISQSSELGFNPGANNNTVYFYNLNTIDASINSSPTLNAYLTDHPIEFTYPLATPIEIQLTPHEISLLKDYAYVSTNGTTIALDYHNGELASLSDVAQLSETVERLTEYIKGLINNA